MGYRDKITRIAQKAHDNDLRTGYDDLDFIAGALDSISNYHNTVIKMEQQMDIQKFRLAGDDFRDWLEEQNKSRILSHEVMINAVAQLNRYCKNNGLEPFYDGPFDDEKRYDDPDTRFGIAEMSEEYCSEIFLASQNTVVNQRHLTYMKGRLAELENNNVSSKKISVKKDKGVSERGYEFDFDGNGVQETEDVPSQ